LKIALIGTRGVPAQYGGFETCVEELGRRLVERGHSVTVYCRRSYYDERPERYLGMRLVHLPSIRRRSLDTLSHTCLSVLHAVTESYDAYVVFNAANSPALLLPRLLGKKIVINPDGLEWKRGKWGPVARGFYRGSAWLAARLANRIVADSPGIQDYYRETYGVPSSYVAYGAYLRESRKPALLQKLGVRPGGYFLQIARLEPENNPLLTIQAYRRLRTDKKLLVIGGVPYESAYSREVAAQADENVLLPGFVYDKELLAELWTNCYAYVHGNEVGGTNPSLLQTMASGCFTIAIDVRFSRDVLRDGGIYYRKSPEALAEKMSWALANGPLLPAYKERARARIEECFSWETVADGYEQVLGELVAGKYPWRPVRPR
jgi:glycosyltransferase involved in cell wall biosynthesis